MSQIRVYFSSVTCSREVKKQQQQIMSFLDAKKIAHATLDVTQGDEVKHEMRRIVGNDMACPPQICNGDQYCGDYEAFASAVEEERVEKFLKL